MASKWEWIWGTPHTGSLDFVTDSSNYDKYWTLRVCFLCVRCFWNCFTSVNSLMLHHNHMWQVLQSSPSYRWGNWGTERVTHLPQIQPLASGGGAKASHPKSIPKSLSLPFPSFIFLIGNRIAFNSYFEARNKMRGWLISSYFKFKQK